MALTIEYRRQIAHNELLLYQKGEAPIPLYYDKMLLNNRINGILRYQTTQVNLQTYFSFEISGKTPISEYFDHRRMNFHQLKELLESLVHIITESREYLIDEGDFVLHPDCMFFTAETNSLNLCCYPGYQRELRGQLSELFEYLMNHVDYNDQPAVVSVYELYMKSKESNCSFEEILQVLEKNRERKAVPVSSEAEKEFIDTRQDISLSSSAVPSLDSDKPIVREASECVLRVQGERPWEEPSAWQKARQLPKRLKGIFSASKEEGFKTTLLYRPPECAPYCLRGEEGSETIYLTSFPFYIGQKGANVDYEIESPVISRMHAKLTKQEDNIYIEDMCSTNGSFLNGQRVQGNEIQKINIGDELMLADRRYRLLRQS